MRWSQLDAYSYALAEAGYVWKNLLSPPHLVISASPSASNYTDREFVQTGALSPSLFVHTLPNVRCSLLCQIMEWSGPVITIQKDPHTFLEGLVEGFHLVGERYPVIWIVTVTKTENRVKVGCIEMISGGPAISLEDLVSLERSSFAEHSHN